MPERRSYWPKSSRIVRSDSPSHPHYHRVAARAGHRCEYCKAPEHLYTEYFHVEHVLPVAWGGLDIFGNYALACPACNEAKRHMLGAMDPADELPLWLFNPRTSRWSDHFRVVMTSGRIDGITEKGRLTARVLKMNVVKSLIARQMWVLAGLWP